MSFHFNYKVVMGNKDHIGRLLQLILGVAINCSKQAEYIQQIMEMEEEVQRLIMLAIQELHGLPTQSIHSMPVIEDDAQVVINSFFLISTNLETC
jgi:HOOK domain